MTDTERAVVNLLANIDAATRTGDVELSLRCVTDDAINMPPDQPAVVGKDALRSWWQQFQGAFAVDMTHEPVETVDAGEFVIHRGNVTGTLTLKEGDEPVRLNNKYLWVLRKEADGGLKIWRGAFNSNVPPNAPQS